MCELHWSDWCMDAFGDQMLHELLYKMVLKCIPSNVQTQSLPKPLSSCHYISAVLKTMFKYGFPPWLHLYFLFSLQDFMICVFSPHWTESNTGPEWLNEHVDGACFNVCFNSGKASSVCSQRQREKERKPPGQKLMKTQGLRNVSTTPSTQTCF